MCMSGDELDENEKLKDDISIFSIASMFRWLYFCDFDNLLSV